MASLGSYVRFQGCSPLKISGHFVVTSGPLLLEPKGGSNDLRGGGGGARTWRIIPVRIRGLQPWLVFVP